jgi:signal transduction histidine kinase
MSPPETSRRLFARMDVRAALSMTGILLLAIAVQCLGLSAFIAVEGLEEGDRWVQHSLRLIQSAEARGGSPEQVIEDLRSSLEEVAPAVRLWRGDGSRIATFGEWPGADRRVASLEGDDQRQLRDFPLLWGDRQLVGEAPLADGDRVALALPLTYLANETTEVVEGLLLIGLLSGLISLIVATRTTSRAFGPVRDATQILREIDARHLGRRIETRGSGDPVDRHSETLNRVLSGIDASFARVRAFGSDVAHELRTPINRIRTMAEVALLSDDPREFLRTLEAIRGSSEEVSRIIDSLLLLSEIDDEGFELQREPVDLDARILRTADIYAPSFEERGIDLQVHTRAGTIHADGTLIDRVLVNLLDNALRYVRRGDVVEIGGFRSDGGVVIHVDDSGPGIPHEERDRIFDRFARLDPARSVGGSGLGLALARGIARLHGGDLEAGDSPRGGARFVWRLPDPPPQGQREARRASPAPSTTNSTVGAQAATVGGSRWP